MLYNKISIWRKCLVAYMHPSEAGGDVDGLCLLSLKYGHTFKIILEKRLCLCYDLCTSFNILFIFLSLVASTAAYAAEFLQSMKKKGVMSMNVHCVTMKNRNMSVRNISVMQDLKKAEKKVMQREGVYIWNLLFITFMISCLKRF